MYVIWKLDHIPNSCIVLMVHMVQGRQYSVCTVYKTQRFNHREGVWDQLTSFDASITGDELDSAVQLLGERQIARGIARRMHDAIYSARLALFIHGITSAKRTREVRPAVLVRKSSTQLLIYSLDKCVRYSTYLPIFKSQKGFMEALHFG